MAHFTEVFKWNRRKYTVRDLAAIRGVSPGEMRHRIRKYGVKVAMAMPKQGGGARLDNQRKNCKIDPDSQQQRSYDLGGSEGLIAARIRLGWSATDANTIPALPHGGASRHWRETQRRGDLAKLGIIA